MGSLNPIAGRPKRLGIYGLLMLDKAGEFNQIVQVCAN